MEGPWFILVTEVSLHGSPNFFNWVQIGTLSRTLPPGDVILCKDALDIPAGMFRIIILRQSVAVWIHLLHKWDKRGQQDVSILCCSHDPAEHHKVCGSSLGNASPHMDLWRMFVLVFELSRGLLLSEALPVVTLQLECGLAHQ